MKGQSRTEYSIRNSSVASLARVVTIVLGYVTRVVFTHMLGQEYVGISGLFLDVFNVLSLSELGISVAITYALYKPIAENDIEKQKAVMDLYRRLYLMVAMIVLIAGLAIYPFLDVLIKGQPEVEHLRLIYLLYLTNSVVSYLFVYKKTLIDACQHMYVSMLYYGGFMTLQYVLQIVVLVLTRNFILYLVVYLMCTLTHNIAVSRRAEKMFPFLKEKKVLPLPREEKKDIFKNLKAMLMHKVGYVAVKNTDTLLLSSMIGIVATACYTNYYLVIGSVQQVLNQAFQGVAASIGNLGVSEEDNKLEQVFEAGFFVGYWIYGFSAVCLYELLELFIAVSFGTEYLFTTEVTFVLCMNFYLTGMRQASLSFRDSLGLFWYDRYKSVIEALVNLIASILLALQFGVIGIFLGTCISTVIVPLWLEPYILYKYRIHRPMKGYFIKFGLYTGVLLVGGIITHTICRCMEGPYIFQLLTRIPICVIVPNMLILLFFHKTEEFKFLQGKICSLLRR